MQTVAPHARLAVLRDDLVIFDLRNDRYIALPGAIAPDDHSSSTAPFSARLVPGATTVLAKAGILIDGDGNDQPSLLQPTSTLQPAIRYTLRPRDIAYLMIALARAGWRLSRGRHCSTFNPERLPPLRSSAESDCAKAIACLAALRLFVPTPRRCLPAALVVGLALKMQGLEAEIVFGVRSHPFEAHCWLQRGTLVIDDDLDRVMSYTPIAVGRL